MDKTTKALGILGILVYLALIPAISASEYTKMVYKDHVEYSILDANPSQLENELRSKPNLRYQTMSVYLLNTQNALLYVNTIDSKVLTLIEPIITNHVPNREDEVMTSRKNAILDHMESYFNTFSVMSASQQTNALKEIFELMMLEKKLGGCFN